MSKYYSTSRNNHNNRMKLIKFIRKTGAFMYSKSTDTCSCYICERRLRLGKSIPGTVAMECDHVIPVSAFPVNDPDPFVKADAYRQANNINNLAPLCRQCNRSKRDHMLPVFVTRSVKLRNKSFANYLARLIKLVDNNVDSNSKEV